MAIKLFATDVDGTLLNNSRQISEGNKAKIRQAVKDGMIFTIATGRMHHSATPFVDDLGLGDIPLISYNGAMIRLAKSHKILYAEYLEENIIHEVLDYAKEVNVYAQLYSNDTLCYRESCDKSRTYEMRARVQGEALGDELYNRTEKVSKMLVYVEKEQMAEMLKLWQNKFAGRLNIVQSSPEYIELVNTTVSKANAIFKLAEILGIDRKDILAIGDSGNDVAMLSECEYGVVMGNGTPEAKAVAKYQVADNEHDGLAEAIDRFFYEKAQTE